MQVEKSSLKTDHIHTNLYTVVRPETKTPAERVKQVQKNAHNVELTLENLRG